MGKCDALSQHANHNIRSDDNCDSTLLQPKFFVICTLEGMTMEGVEQDMLHEVCKEVVKHMTSRYNIETGKSNTEILTPGGQDLASTYKKLHLPSSRCPISDGETKRYLWRDQTEVLTRQRIGVLKNSCKK